MFIVFVLVACFAPCVRQAKFVLVLMHAFRCKTCDRSLWIVLAHRGTAHSGS